MSNLSLLSGHARGAEAPAKVEKRRESEPVRRGKRRRVLFLVVPEFKEKGAAVSKILRVVCEDRAVKIHAVRAAVQRHLRLVGKLGRKRRHNVRADVRRIGNDAVEYLVERRGRGHVQPCKIHGRDAVFRRVLRRGRDRDAAAAGAEVEQPRAARQVGNQRFYQQFGVRARDQAVR